MKPYLSLLITFLICTSGFSQSHRDTISIHHYNLTLDMTAALSGVISGKAELKLTLTEPTNTFVLDLYKLTTDSVIINNRAIDFTYTDSTVRIENTSAINSDTIVATIYYHGSPKKDPDWGGFFSDGIMAYNIGVGMGSYPHGIGRFWYPCNDAFTDRATYDYHIITRQTEVGVASGLLISDSTQNGKNYYHWHLAQTIPTYLSSIAVGPFIKIEDTYVGIEKAIPIEIFALKSDSLASTLTFNKLKETMAAFEKRFGAYQWDKIGYSVVNFGSGAMEHVTNIAYPANQLYDNMSARNLVAHELAHHWFGNLVTCSQSADMWLNEGWASYCETIFKEEVYSPESGLIHTLNNQIGVIKSTHLADGGYYALTPIPRNITYGSTVYDKGALVVHCLRGYLGDDLFFSAIQEFLTQNQYKSISSDYLQTELSKITGVNLSDFFNNWVYQPGFPHYSVNYFDTKQSDEGYLVTIELRQKLIARNLFSQQNRLPLCFIDDKYNTFDTTLTFNGETELFNITLPFKPISIFTDVNNRVLDATTQDKHTISEAGYTTFTNCDFKLNTIEIQDSALLRVQYNYLQADDFITPQKGLSVSNHYYWKLEGVLPTNFNGEGKFSFNFSTNTDNTSAYLPAENDTVVLLFREDARKNWSVIAKGESTKIKTGYFWTKEIKMGEYALGYWDGQSPIGIENRIKKTAPYIYPNPFQDNINICWQEPFWGKIQVTNISGYTLFEKTVANKTIESINTQEFPLGMLFIVANGNANSVTKAIKTR